MTVYIYDLSTDDKCSDCGKPIKQGKIICFDCFQQYVDDQDDDRPHEPVGDYLSASEVLPAEDLPF